MRVGDFLRELWKLLKGIGEGVREQTTSVLEEELREMEGAYALLLLGSFLGIPAPPSFVGLSLMPYLEREFTIALTRSRFLGDAAAFWFEIADI